MTNWPRLIGLGWPGAATRIDHKDDPMLPLRMAKDETLAGRIIEVGDYRVEWLDKAIAKPKASDILGREAELQALADAEDAARAKVKAFKAAWPHEKLVEYLSDDAKKQQVIDAAKAVV